MHPADHKHQLCQRQLSPRLAAAAACVLRGHPVADIGTDHGYLPIELVQSGAVPSAIAVDVRPAPLAVARSSVEAAQLDGKIEIRLGDGLQALLPDDKVHTATLCGIGGGRMVKILQRSSSSLLGGDLQLKRLVLQPMGAEDEVRSWLAANGWALVDEVLVREGAARWYVILIAEPGTAVPHTPTPTEADLLIGTHLRSKGGALFVQYVEWLLQRTRRAARNAARSSNSDAAARCEVLAQRVRLLEDVLLKPLWKMQVTLPQQLCLCLTQQTAGKYEAGCSVMIGASWCVQSSSKRRR